MGPLCFVLPHIYPLLQYDVYCQEPQLRVEPLAGEWPRLRGAGLGCGGTSPFHRGVTRGELAVCAVRLQGGVARPLCEGRCRQRHGSAWDLTGRGSSGH